MSSTSTTNRILISCVVLLVIACLCACLIGLGASIVAIIAPPRFPTSTPRATQPQSARPTPTPRSAATPSPSNQTPGNPASLSPEIAAQMDQIEQEVVQIRGLQPKQSTDRSLLSPDQLRQHVVDDMLKDYTPEEAQNDVISLAAFGLLEPGFDMRTLYIDLLSEQIAGFYDNKVKSMYIVQGEDFLGLQRMTYAHEYTHALQDQAYDIENGLNYSDEFCEQDSEHCAAVQALLEGDATLAELDWLSSYSTANDKKEIAGFYATYKSPVYDRSPEFLKQDFIFPYQQGLEFVQKLHDDGGWQAVDQAYLELPTSTEQILHPEKYPADQPLSVSLPTLTLGDGWEEVDHGVMGEWYTRIILAYGWDENARLSESKATQAAAGWGGDAYQVYYNAQSQATIMVLVTQWDTATDASEFSAAFQEYAADRFGKTLSEGDGGTFWQAEKAYTAFYHTSAQTTWILAPEAQTAQTLWQQLNP